MRRRVGRVTRDGWFGRGAALAFVVALTVAGCSSSSHPSAASTTGGKGASGAPAAPSASPTPVVPKVSLVGSKSSLSYLKPVKLQVANGSFVSMLVLTKSNQQLDGGVSGDGSSWLSEVPPKPDLSYTATARVKDSTGSILTKTVSFQVAKVPDAKKVAFTVTPNAGATVGIGQPIVVRFLTPISRRSAFQKVMNITAEDANGKQVVGAWRWLNDQEVHWRPENFWTPGTKVDLNMKIAGVKAATDRYGRQDYSQTFTIGSSHVTRVDASTDRVKVYRDGKLVNTWPTATGRPGLQTYSGTYVVLGKSSVVKMDSCSARITCDKKNSDYYNEKEYWATRITASGTFLHAASWDSHLGSSNTSHGCIHLSDANAENFYNHAVPGDVVIVKNTGRGPQERIDTQDPGLYDWNIPWSKWTSGSDL